MGPYFSEHLAKSTKFFILKRWRVIIEHDGDGSEQIPSLEADSLILSFEGGAWGKEGLEHLVGLKLFKDRIRGSSEGSDMLGKGEILIFLSIFWVKFFLQRRIGPDQWCSFIFR